MKIKKKLLKNSEGTDISDLYDSKGGVPQSMDRRQAGRETGQKMTYYYQ